MFRIGEFAQIAQVTGRLLRYYDGLGLLSPVRTDPETGYRFYSAAQLPRLNRILALKELGLSLEEIAKLLDREVSAEELRGMLAMRQAEARQALAEQQARLARIESRIRQIDEAGALGDYDVVVKAQDARPFLAVRQKCADMNEAVALLQTVVREVPRHIDARLRGNLTVVGHPGFDDDALDLEVGFALNKRLNDKVVLPGNLEMSVSTLPAADMATLVRSGPAYQSHLAFGSLGIWMEANGYEVAGPCREVFLELPFAGPAADESVVEIQFPVTRAA